MNKVISKSNSKTTAFSENFVFERYVQILL